MVDAHPVAPTLVRRLTERDAAAFRAVRLRALKEDPASFLASYEEDCRLSVEEFAERLRPLDPHTGVLGAFRDAELVGTVGFYRHAHVKARHRASLWGMYVVPEERGKRVGTHLLDAALGHLRQLKHIEQIELTVVVGAEPARHLYLAAGFDVQGKLARSTRVGDGYFDEEVLILLLGDSAGDGASGGAAHRERSEASPLRPKDAGTVERLAARSPSDCLPMMLEVVRRHAGRRRPADVIRQFGRDRFVAPSLLDLGIVHRLDGMALEAAAGFEPVLLSPLAPLGVCAAVSPSNQNRIVSTIRGSEVVSDPTNVLAVECARRLARDGLPSVRLCTLHQTVRAQRFQAKPGHSAHFRLFALAEAGHAVAEHAFEVDAVVRHVCVFWKLLDACEKQGSRFDNRRATLLVAGQSHPLGERIRDRLRVALPDLPIEDGTLTSGYYDGVRLLFDADSASGQRVNIADTGLLDWVGKLTSNHRLRYVASALGLQLLPLLFGRWRAE